MCTQKNCLSETNLEVTHKLRKFCTLKLLIWSSDSYCFCLFSCFSLCILLCLISPGSKLCLNAVNYVLKISHLSNIVLKMLDDSSPANKSKSDLICHMSDGGSL